MKNKSYLPVSTKIWMLIFGIFFFQDNSSKNKIVSLQQLMAHRGGTQCYCVPAVGFDCFSSLTGTIMTNYKIECGVEDELALFALR
jgi:hypothetical protein